MKICVLGANSAIAQACIERWAAAGESLYLVGRNGEALKRLSCDLAVRFDRAFPCEMLDLDLFDQHAAVLDRATTAMAGLDVVFMAQGVLGNQKEDQDNWPAIHANLTTNFLSCASLATHAATLFEQQGHGTIAVIGSVAGDRGRPSNYIYGAGKGGLALFLSGMRARLAKKGVHVLTIKPGFVRTPMTAHKAHGPLFASPERVARAIQKAILHKKNVAYIPFWWRGIMTLIRLIPEPIFKRLPS